MQKLCAHSTVIFGFALLLLQATARATDLSYEQLAAENARLRQENEDLRAENKELREPFRLEDVQNDESLELRSGRTAGHKSQVSELAEMTAPNDTLLEDDEDCSDHCNGDCTIPPYQIDKHCRATSDFLQKTKKKIVSVGTSSHPQWDLYNKELDTVIGSVQCPCSASDGSPLDAKTAISHIIGQMGAIGLDPDVAKRFLAQKTDSKGNPETGATYVAALGYTAVVMMTCWQRSCAPSTPALSTNLLDELSLTSLLQAEDSSNVQFGGGSAC